MTTVITRFPLPSNTNVSEIRHAFAAAAPAFHGVPGLLRKHFLLAADCRSAGGVYLWESEAAARAFMQERVVPMIREKFSVESTIEFFDSPVIVENSRSDRSETAGVPR